MIAKLNWSIFTISLVSCLLVFGAWLLAQWPGYFSPDTYYVLDSISQQYIDDWHSYLYVLYLSAFYKLGLNIGAVGGFQVILFSLLASLFFAAIAGQLRNKAVVFLCLSAFLLSPLNGIFNIFYVRDSLFSWLLVSLSLWIAYLKLVYQEVSFAPAKSLVGMAVLTAAISKLRIESAPLILLVPLILYFSVKITKVEFLKFLGWLLGASLVVHIMIPKWVDVYSAPTKYKLASVVNPVSHLLVNQYRSSDIDGDRRIINKVFDYDLLVKTQDDLHTANFPYEGWRKSTRQEDLEMLKLSLKMVSENLDLFFANRIKIFASMSGFFEQGYFSDDLTANDPLAMKIKEDFNIKKAWPQSDFALLFTNIAKRVTHEAGWLHLIVSTQLIPYVVALIALVLFPIFPCSAIAVLIVSARLPLVFLLAPANQFKYTYANYLLLFFLVPIMAIEWQRKRIKAKTPIMDLK